MDIRFKNLTAMNADEWIQYISSYSLTKDELCWLYCCGLCWHNLLADPENLSVVTKAMLDNGMDPNQLVTEDLPDEKPDKNYYYTPLISATRFNDCTVTAESLKHLLDYGGNPNLQYSFADPDENVFEFYVEDVFANAPDLNECTFYGILLCAAYGGKNRNGFNPFTMLIDSPISIFKDYDLYWYEYMDDTSSSFYIVEKETGRRVARYH